MHMMNSSLHLFSSCLAYIDPGSGSYFYQIAIAGLTTVVFFFSKLKRWTLGLFRRPNPQAPAADTPRLDVKKTEPAKDTVSG